MAFREHARDRVARISVPVLSRNRRGGRGEGLSDSVGYRAARGWQGNYFLGVGDVRAPHEGGVRGHAVGFNPPPGQPINALRFLSSGRYPGACACTRIYINACARGVRTCRLQLRGGRPTPGGRCNRDDTLANTSTWTRTPFLLLLVLLALLFLRPRALVTDENCSQRDCH